MANRTLKILHVSSAVSWRGGEHQISLLVQGLNKLGHQNFIMAPMSCPLLDNIKELGLESFTYRKRASISLTSALKLKNICSNHNVDIVHIHDSHAQNYFITASILFNNKVPAVLSRRVDFLPSTKWKYNLKNIRKIICVSNKVKQIITPIITDTERLHTIHDGIDPTYKPMTSLKEKFNLPRNHKVIVNIAALAGHKDHVTFLKTAKILIYEKKLASIFFIIGGDAGEEGKLKELCKKFELEDHVIFTGHIPNAIKFLYEADLFLFTSKEEGMGSSLLDAMNYGVPIVTTNAGGIPEIVTDKENGLVCPVSDPEALSEAVIDLLADHNLRKNIIKRGYEVADKHSYLNMAKQTLETYFSVLN